MENILTSYDARIPGIKKEADGRYTIDLVRSVHGQRVHVCSSGFLTAEDAIAAMPRLIEMRTTYVSESTAGQITFEVFLLRYDTYRLLHVRKSTTQLARSVIKRFFSAYLERNVNEVFSFSCIRKAYDEILSSRGGACWKNRCFGTLRLMAECAYKWKYITSDAHRDCISILENIPENRGAKNEKRIWSRAEKARFLAAIDDKDDKTMFILFITLGARIGEFMGLTWDCFDEKRGTIEIKQQLVYQNTGRWVLSKDLKTRESYRVCRLSPAVTELLKAYKSRTSGKGFMFRSVVDINEPLSKASFRTKMVAYIKKAKVKMITPHAIRHSKATELMRVCRNMQEVKAAARYLGHSATMMIDTYGHSERSATDAVLRRLEKEEGLLFDL